MYTFIKYTRFRSSAAIRSTQTPDWLRILWLAGPKPWFRRRAATARATRLRCRVSSANAASAVPSSTLRTRSVIATSAKLQRSHSRAINENSCRVEPRYVNVAQTFIRPQGVYWTEIWQHAAVETLRGVALPPIYFSLLRFVLETRMLAT